MPKPLWPHLLHERTRHGALVWYVRIGKGPRIRIKEEFGTDEFKEAYLAALAGDKTATNPGSKIGSLAWLVERYSESSHWTRLSPATQSQRRNIYKVMLKKAGDIPVTAITKAKIEEARDVRRETPFAANDFLKAMRGLFQWAVKAKMAKVNPTEGVDGFGHKTKGFHTWTDEEIERFEARWPIGTRERLALAILLYTGLRRGDAANLGRQHVRDGVITMRTAKTGTIVDIPILPALNCIIEASKTGDGAFIATPSGGPMTKESFGNWFRDACNAAGVPGAAHGLRKAGATRAANNGATEAELEALFGWSGGRMASLYTRSANRKRLARGAIDKMEHPAPTARTK